MTASSSQTGQSGGRVRPRGSTRASLVAAVLLMAALFLAHGLQCAAAADHGPKAMTHTLAVPVAPSDVIHHGTTGYQSEPTMLVRSLADPVAAVGGGDVLGQAVLACFAVLTAVGLWFRLARKALLSGQGLSWWPAAAGSTSRLSAAARWRPPPLDLTILCVLRT